jgi:hypothetical protein
MNLLLNTLQLTNALIFLIIAGFHTYWAMGGQWGSDAVIPVIDGKKAFSPPPIITLMVAVAMLGAAYISYANSPQIMPYANAAIAFVFLARAIGDFNYVGFSKKIKNSLFARNDTRYYSPLCLLIAIIAMAIFLLHHLLK